ncbi:flagellar basal body L-ring protein FlgH [Luteitalea pratensis]|uniref:flagellar basal body L-ring protein FlgH n=1 Tax=Luteitalea pratensis TaxID=1855912 RepID=UPI0012FF7A53|nr:flagellar basal body L-ring protein FlgH [Luteitalea pratensis]
MIAAVGSLLAAAPLFAQSSTKPSNDTYDQAVARHLETARQLARASAAPSDEPSFDWITGLTSDRRASRVNDLITVRVIENIESSATADSQLDKESKAKAAVPTLFGLETKLPDSIDPNNLASTRYESAFKGGGSTTRTSMLTATMTTRVSEVLPNGDLVLEGVREIDLNGERQVVVLTGIVRAQDLRRSNQVLSTQVAQLRIQYYGKGLMKDNLKPGWLVRVLNKVF